MDKKQKKKRFDKKRNRELYNKYIQPNERDVETLVYYYSTIPHIRKDITIQLKANFYEYIHTYDESKSIDTWIHIVAKRFVFYCENKYRKEREMFTDYLYSENMQNANGDYAVNAPYDPLDMEYYKNNLDDVMYMSLMDLRDELRVPFLLLSHGYSISEITKHELERGAISWMSQNSIKTRIKLAKDSLKKRIKHHKKCMSMNKIVYKINKAKYGE